MKYLLPGGPASILLGELRESTRDRRAHTAFLMELTTKAEEYAYQPNHAKRALPRVAPTTSEVSADVRYALVNDVTYIVYLGWSPHLADKQDPYGAYKALRENAAARRGDRDA